MIVLRSCLTIAAILTAITACQKFYLRYQCPQLIELQASRLEHNEDWASLEPVWARVNDATTPLHPAIVTSAQGKKRGALLPLASAQAPDKILAVVAFDNASDALAVYAPGAKVAVYGVGRVPTPETEETMSGYAARAGLTISPVWRILTPEEEPLTLTGLGGLTLLGSLLAALFYLSIRYQNAANAAWTPLREKIATFFPRQDELTYDEPLPAEFKIRVRSMMDDIWDEAREGRRASSRA